MVVGSKVQTFERVELGKWTLYDVVSFLVMGRHVTEHIQHGPP